MSVLFVRAFAKYLTREHLTDCYEISLTVERGYEKICPEMLDWSETCLECQPVRASIVVWQSRDLLHWQTYLCFCSSAE